MSPILVRPVREQLEHDRVIRLLQAKYKRKFDVAINPGHDRAAPVGPAAAPWYPDLVLQAGARGKKLAGVVEVETMESLNHLEAMSQWVAFSNLRVAFHLYVPLAGVDSARRLCAESKVTPAELWTYQTFGEQIRFTLASRGVRTGGRIASRPTAAASPTRARTTRSPAAARPPATGSRRPAAGARTKARTGTAAKSTTKKAAPAARSVKTVRPRRTAASARAQKRR